MLSKKKLSAMKYLKAEYTRLQNDPILSLGCTVGLPNLNDIFHWKKEQKKNQLNLNQIIV